MSVHVVLDSSVLAVPREASSGGAVRRFADALLEWCDLLDQPWAGVSMSEAAVAALVEDGCFPDFDSLSSLFKKHGVVEYSVNDVGAIVGGLVSRTQSFEHRIGIRDVLLQNQAVVTTPNILAWGPGDHSRACLRRCLVSLAVVQEYCDRSPVKHVLGLCHTPGAGVRVRAPVYDVEHDRDDLSLDYS